MHQNNVGGNFSKMIIDLPRSENHKTCWSPHFDEFLFLTFSLPEVTNKQFLHTISMHYQPDSRWEDCEISTGVFFKFDTKFSKLQF